jgi:hypothetical protein
MADSTPSPRPEDDPLWGVDFTQTGDTPCEGPDYSWPADKFGMRHEDLFDRLTPLFNTTKIQIRSHAAFVTDVRHACGEASTAQELYDILARRKAVALKRFEAGFDESRTFFSKRRHPKLLQPQFFALIDLLQSRTLTSVLDVLWASQLADDSSGDDMWTARLHDRSYGVEPRPWPTCDPVESLPPTPTPVADPAEPPCVGSPGPAPRAADSRADTAPPPPDPGPGPPLGARQPHLASMTRPTINVADSGKSTNLPIAPALASPASSSQPSSRTTAASDASPATPNSRHQERPKRAYGTPEQTTSYNEDVVPPQPLSRKRSLGEAGGGDDPTGLHRQQKRAKG